jgi:hypothetical protein
MMVVQSNNCLMKHMLILAAVAALSVAAVPSCSLTPEQQAKVMAFTDLGVSAFVANGTLKPGTSILIKEGVGLITSFNAAPKEVPLAKIGLDDAVREGTVETGDKVIIGPENATVVSPPDSPDLGPINSLLPPPKS